VQQAAGRAPRSRRPRPSALNSGPTTPFDSIVTVGVPLTQCELAAHDLLLSIPTGLSSDGLTLFFFDPARNAARAAWRSAVGAPFTWFRDLPHKGVVAPGNGCQCLYYSQQGDGALMSAPVQ
jgi:hypothetical protein